MAGKKTCPLPVQSSSCCDTRHPRCSRPKQEQSNQNRNTEKSAEVTCVGQSQCSKCEDAETPTKPSDFVTVVWNLNDDVEHAHIPPMFGKSCNLIQASCQSVSLFATSLHSGPPVVAPHTETPKNHAETRAMSAVDFASDKPSTNLLNWPGSQQARASREDDPSGCEHPAVVRDRFR